MTDQTETPDRLGNEPIDRMVGPFVRFLHVEAASGVVLLLATITALVLANSPWADGFMAFWKTPVGFRFGGFEFVHSLQHFINDGLMAIFFFVIGLEVKREIVLGELRELRRAAFPIAGALGGMLVPAVLYLFVEFGEPGQRCWGIPMATDIAFVVGCMALLGPRVPRTLRITLLSMAIADDIGAILVIAIAYTEGVSFAWLGLGAVGIVLVSVLARLGVRNFAVYTVLGGAVWFAFHESGVHATIAGVILGLMTPARSYLSPGRFGEMLRKAESVATGDWSNEPHRAERLRRFRHAARETIAPLEYLENGLHPYVGFVIMPIFALANAGVPVEPSALGSRLALAVMLGLVIGKPLGITMTCWLAVKFGLARMPEGLNWKIIIGGGSLCGIGFTMALFIAGLAAPDEILDTAKVGVLGASVVSAVLAMTLLFLFLPPKKA